MAAETRATTLEQARDFHRQFIGASAGELAVVGDFDSKAIAALTAKLFAELEKPQTIHAGAAPRISMCRRAAKQS